MLGNELRVELFSLEVHFFLAEVDALIKLGLRFLGGEAVAGIGGEVGVFERFPHFVVSQLSDLPDSFGELDLRLVADGGRCVGLLHQVLVVADLVPFQSAGRLPYFLLLAQGLHPPQGSACPAPLVMFLFDGCELHMVFAPKLVDVGPESMPFRQLAFDEGGDSACLLLALQCTGMAIQLGSMIEGVFLVVVATATLDQFEEGLQKEGRRSRGFCFDFSLPLVPISKDGVVGLVIVLKRGCELDPLY